jgi:hypothetical protein
MTVQGLGTIRNAVVPGAQPVSYGEPVRRG